MPKPVAIENQYVIYDDTDRNNGWFVYEGRNTRGRKRGFWTLQEAVEWCRRDGDE